MRILVPGNIKMDLTTYDPKLSLSGDPLQHRLHITVPGGKGNNQVIAPEYLGAKTQFIGQVGNDVYKPQVQEIVAAEDADVCQVIKDPDNKFGIAITSVDDPVDNVINILSGENFALNESDVQRIQDQKGGTEMLMRQQEIPPAVKLAGAIADEENGLTGALDSTPTKTMPEEVYPYFDFITPDELEAETLAGILPTIQLEAAQVTNMLLEKGVGIANIRMGAQGAHFENLHDIGFKPAFKGNAINTADAGEVLSVGLTVILAEGSGISKAMRWAAGIGAIAITTQGVLPTMPYRIEFLDPMADQT